MSLKIAQAVLKSRKKLDNETLIDQLLSFVQPLIEQDKDGETLEGFEFEEEQSTIAKLLHLVTNQDVDIEYALLQKWKKIITSKACGEQWMRYTIPPFVFLLFKLIYRVDA